jgi:predicted nucleotidyltransferase component of viral defense system
MLRKNFEMNIEELDLPDWVSCAEPNKKNFREAVHIILTAISLSTVLRSTMVMKGGMLMAIRYHSTRFTKDADFSTEEKYLKGNEEELIAELSRQIDVANETLPYDTMCRCQRSELRPARGDAIFPTLTMSIGYAPRSKPRELTRLLNGQSPTIVEIDYSYNEVVMDVEILKLSDGEELQAYSFLNLVAEKFRSLLQQPIRNRNRRQDVYDLNLLISDERPLLQAEQQRLLDIIIASCKERSIKATQNSLADPAVRKMAEDGYENLAPEVEEPLPAFPETYQRVQKFYEDLPWK